MLILSDSERKKYDGDLNADHFGLVSLDGSPETVDGEFRCDGNMLTSLEGGPTIVGQDYRCNNNRLTSLKGAPKQVTGFHCQFNELTSLEHAPETIIHLANFADNKLTSLKGIHKIIKKVGSSIDFTGNDISSHVLGLMKIEGLMIVYLDNKKVQNILNKHLLKGTLLECQEELIDAGKESFAQF